jgi:hypothetical protein
VPLLASNVQSVHAPVLRLNADVDIHTLIVERDHAIDVTVHRSEHQRRPPIRISLVNTVLNNVELQQLLNDYLSAELARDLENCPLKLAVCAQDIK